MRGPTASRSGESRAYRLEAPEPAILGAEVVLVWLVAAQQVVGIEALDDGLADRPGVTDDADRQRRERGVVRCVVERERAAIREREEDSGIFVVRAQRPQAQPSARRERVGDVAEEPLDVGRHEVRLLAAREAVQREESIERGAALDIGGPAKACVGRLLEATDLPTQLVTLFLPEALHVRFEIAR